MKKLWKRFINWLDMEIEIYSFTDSVAAMNMDKKEVDKYIEIIKNKYKSKQQEQ
jgi:hypothetical protein